MEALQDLFPSRSERELQEVLDEASQSFDRALEILLERPAAPPPRPRPLQNLAKRVSNVIEAPPLTPATASALSFMNMTLSGDDDRQKGSPKAPQLPRQVITISDDEEAGKSPNIVAKAVSKGDSESETVAYILSIFPDVCPESTRELYKAHRYLQGSSVAEFLVDKYLEEGYVKAEKVGQKRKRKASDGEEASARKKDAYDPAGRPPSTQNYRRAVERLLQQEFPLTPANYISKVFRANLSFLASTYPHLVAAEKLVNSRDPRPPYKPLLSRRKIMDDNGAFDQMGSEWNKILEELGYARDVSRSYAMQQQVEADAQIAAQLNEKEYEAADMLWECKCCFTETPFDNMTHCGEGTHFFCLGCARMNAETEIGNGRYKLKCMDGSGCQAEFPRREVLRFIKNEKTLALLSKLEAEEAIRIAAIDNLERCPFCDNAAICNSIEIDKEFRCDGEECGIVSCRLCKRKSHIPKTCEEAAKDDNISTRHRVEEAMTKAMMRKCNKCQAPFIKQDGCNKIVCTTSGCRNIQCYVCSQNIADYSHFARGPSDQVRKGQCPLYDNHEQRHEDEIRQAALAEVEKLRKENPGISDKDLQIRISDEVKKSEAERKKAAENGGRQARQGNPGFVIPPYNPAAVQPPPPPPPQPRAQPQQPVPPAMADPRIQPPRGRTIPAPPQPPSLFPRNMGGYPLGLLVPPYQPQYYGAPLQPPQPPQPHLPAAAAPNQMQPQLIYPPVRNNPPVNGVPAHWLFPGLWAYTPQPNNYQRLPPPPPPPPPRHLRPQTQLQPQSQPQKQKAKRK